MGNKTVNRIVCIDESYLDFYDALQAPNPVVYHQGYVRNAIDNPKFKDRIKAGSSATNPMTIVIKKVKFRPMVLSIKAQNPWQSTYGKTMVVRQGTQPADKLISSSFSNPVDHSSVDNKALIGIIKKIRETQTSGFSGPAFLVELKQTMSMLRSPFKALRDKTGLLVDLHARVKRDRKIKRDKFKDSDWASIISGTYMEWVFGVKPLIGDMNAIARAAQDKILRSPGCARVSYKYSDVSDLQDTLHFSPAAVSGTVITDRYRSNRYSQMYVVGLNQVYPSLDTMSDKVNNIRNLGRFDFGEILPAAWEGMPWSWLVDYVTNIGDLLACTYDYNSSIGWAKRTSIDTLLCDHISQRFVNSEPVLYPMIGMIGEKFSTEYKVIDRQNVSSLGFPKFELSLPGLNQTNNFLQVLLTIKGKP